MPVFKAERRVDVTPDIAFAVAADVASYKKFLPLVSRSVIRGGKKQTETGETFAAELAVAYPRLGLSESFVSQVNTDNAMRVVQAISSEKPFRALEAKWTITAAPNGCTVAISIDYSFRNPLLQLVASGLMDMAVQKIMSAFEVRAMAIAKQV